ncbi:MAG: Adenylate kinase [Parcubacteria group bacterium GW2011_GWF2_43_11]|nr:MAG: Adenylate kinase [Parcubacteria group bacterium GW2011_GWF2_43_11]
MAKPSVVIILGQPGSGKGTQAELVADKFNLYSLETSKLIETKVMNAKEGEYAEVDGQKYYFSHEKELWTQGILCSPPFVSWLVKTKIEELAKEGRGVVMSGSPRTLIEGQNLIPLLKNLYGAENIRVILLELTAEQTIWRNSHRRICELMRHPILFSKETENLTKCPLDGSNLLRREGLDDPETIKVRLKEYAERTFPLVDFLKKQNLPVINVNGEQSVGDVYRDVLAALK